MNANSSTCNVCHHKPAFFSRSYSGMNLCRRCFLKSIEDKMRATVAKYQMFRFDDRIAVAVSGGKDSVSLLHVLAKVERRHPKAQLVAITVDEGIQGYRDEALNIAAHNCTTLGVEHQIVSFKEIYGYTLDQMVHKLQRKDTCEPTPCAYCGVLRRKALNLAARKVEADKLATAHTLDDETQTILLNIFHGDILRIAKEKPVTDKVHSKLVQRIKPFCEIFERETTLYAYVKGIEFQSEPCPYSSEALRNDARFILNRLEEKHPGITFTIFKSIEKIRPALRDSAAEEGLRECSECGEPTTGKICRTCQMRKRIDLA